MLEESLIDKMAQDLEYDCLSDLYQSLGKSEFIYYIRNISVQEYPLIEWIRAAEYIVGKKNLVFSNIDEVKDYLCNYPPIERYKD